MKSYQSWIMIALLAAVAGVLIFNAVGSKTTAEIAE